MNTIAIKDLNEETTLEPSDMDGIRGGIKSIAGHCDPGTGSGQNPDGILFDSQQPTVMIGIPSQAGNLAPAPRPTLPGPSAGAKPVLKDPPHCPGDWISVV